jgi:hypothetical protein
LEMSLPMRVHTIYGCILERDGIKGYEWKIVIAGKYRLKSAHMVHDRFKLEKGQF